ncbi:MAG TPA: glycosyltransferase family 87 protein [Chloroflexia bacterium]|nr:glycosyltransferase family 87 protein [Chloroflexia bacterium]
MKETTSHTSPVQDQKIHTRNLAITALVAVSLVLILFQFWQLLTGLYDVDFNAFETAIKSLLAGDTPYRAHGTEQAFHYPLWTSFLYLPVAFLGHNVARYSWLTINLVVLAGVVWLLAKVYLPGLKSIYLIPLYCFGLTISTLNLLDGFPGIIVVAGFALMLNAIKQEKMVWAGIWGMLGLVIKPQITFVIGAALLLWLFNPSRSERRRAARWWLSAVVAGFVLLVVSWIVHPNWIQLLVNALKNDNLTGGIGPDGVEYEWVTSTFTSWLNFVANVADPALTILYIIVALGLVAGMVLRLVEWRLALLPLLSLAAALNLAVTPYTRPYDYPLLLLPVFFLLSVIRSAYAKGNRSQVSLCVTGLILVFLVPVYNKDFRWFYLQPFLLIISLLLLKPFELAENEQEIKEEAYAQTTK